MTRFRALVALCVWFVLAFSAGLTASNRWQGWRYADASIRWYNGGTGDYYNVYQEELMADHDSWHNYTAINLAQTGSSSGSDLISSFNGFYGATGWLGLAEILNKSGWTITSGRTRLNQSYLDAGYDRTAKKHVACQEAGHLFGLDHNRVAWDTCMNDTIVTAPHPNAHDVDMLVSIYGGPPPANTPDVLVPGEALFPGQEATSADGRFHLVYQSDGNLVLYRWDWAPIWWSGTSWGNAGMALMQTDGNFVIYDYDGALWHARTWNNPGAFLVVQNDGNVVIYSSNRTPLWWTGTCCY